MGPAFPVGPLGPLSPRGPWRERHGIRMQSGCGFPLFGAEPLRGLLPAPGRPSARQQGSADSDLPSVLSVRAGQAFLKFPADPKQQNGIRGGATSFGSREGWRWRDQSASGTGTLASALWVDVCLRLAAEEDRIFIKAAFK